MQQKAESEGQLLKRFIISRLLLAVCITSYAQPDEFWQGPEISHNEVFGYGYRTWEWTYKDPLRSPVYHQLFNVLYYLLKWSNLDYDILVAYGPRLIQSVISAVFDVYVIKLMILEGLTNLQYMVIVNYTCWFSVYILSRTLVNNCEACLFTIALYYWRKYTLGGNKADNIRCRLFVIVNFALRGTSIIPWVFLWPHHFVTNVLFKRDIQMKDKMKIFIQNVLTVIIMVLVSLSIDSLYYGKLTWCIWNFTKFNLLEGGSSFYGEHSLTWLFVELIPFLFLGWYLFIPFGIYGYVQQKQLMHKSMDLLWMALFFLLVLGLSAHKEDRFLLPLMPIFYILICSGLEYFDRSIERNRLREKFQFSRRLGLIKKIFIGLALISNMIFLVFVILYKDVGALTVIDKLRTNENLKSVQFFTQCHQTPFYSVLHRNIQMEFPDCSPLQPMVNTENYKMLTNPNDYVDYAFKKFVSLPSHLVVYDFLYEKMKEKLDTNYVQIDRIYHALSTETSIGYFDNVHLLILELKK